jgi:hypothetical protein
MEHYSNFETQKNVETISNIPPELTKYKSNTLQENYKINKVIYKKIHPELPWITNKLPLPKELPTQLYNVKNYNLELTENNQNTKTYAILSYVREGEKIKNQVEVLKNYPWWNKEILGEENEKKEFLSSSTKSLHKAIQTCQMMDINYLWMDRLCSTDRDKETSKIGQYYANADITLIAIQANIGREMLNNLQCDFENKEDKLANIRKIIPKSMKVLEAIIKSKWFSRAWTFQEGILSRKTVFMFDDGLVDGRFMATIWIISQPPKIIKHIKVEDIFESSLKVATPLGWAYYDNYSEKDKLFMSLHDALKAVKNREKNNALDAIYSVLGLLPYGGEVEINWNLGPQKALFNVMKIALRNGYGELLTWHGEGEGWLPKIENNSILVYGGVKIECAECKKNKKPCGENKECKKIKNVEFDEKHNLVKSIKIKGVKRFVDETYGEPSKWENESLIDSDIYTLVTKLTNSAEKTRLIGTHKTLEKIKKGEMLLLPNEEEWESEKPFALVVREEKKDTYQRIGLVELADDSESKLINNKDRGRRKTNDLELRSQSTQLLNPTELLEKFQETSTQIEIPPK